MPRKRAVAIEETTTVTQRVTLTDEDTAPVIWAAGSSHGVTSAPEMWNAQRRQQVWRTAEIVVAAAQSGAHTLDDGTLRQAVNILRALPGATPLELTLGRST